MTTNIIRHGLAYTQISTALFTVAAGAAGWVATDCSASVPVHAKAVLFSTYAANAANNLGVRGTGSTVNPVGQWGTNYSVIIAKNYGASSFDLYRDPGGDNNYRVLGYFS